MHLYIRAGFDIRSTHKGKWRSGIAKQEVLIMWANANWLSNTYVVRMATPESVKVCVARVFYTSITLSYAIIDTACVCINPNVSHVYRLLTPFLRIYSFCLLYNCNTSLPPTHTHTIKTKCKVVCFINLNKVMCSLFMRNIDTIRFRCPV
jgi:hypothetical protein